MRKLQNFISGSLLWAVLNLIFPQTSVAQRAADTLLQLTKASQAKHDYVNFDVLSLSLGHGFSTDPIAPHPFAFSWNLQLLWPYAFFREKQIRIGSENIYLSTGLRGGRSGMAWENTQWLSNASNDIQPEKDAGINKSTLRVGYVGVVMLPFVQLGRFDQWTLMAGPAVDYNFRGIMVYKSGHGQSEVKFNKHLRRFSVPLLFQATKIMNSSKTLSLGGFGSFYGQRFKSENTKQVDQVVLGLCGAVII